MFQVFLLVVFLVLPSHFLWQDEYESMSLPFEGPRRQGVGPSQTYSNAFLIVFGILGAVCSAFLVVLFVLVILFHLYMYLTYEEFDYARSAEWKQVRFSQQYSHVRMNEEEKVEESEEGFSPQEISSIKSNRNLEIFDWNAYEIIETLQEDSGKVIVYMTKWNLHNNSIVVVKLFPYDFSQEIRISAFSCNNIVHCSGLTIAPSSYLGLVLEYFENGTIVEYVQKKLPPKAALHQRLKILHNVTQGLEYLHDRKFIMRHLTPNNVFLTKERVAKISLYSIDSIFVRPPEGFHKAPEVVLNEAVDIRSDIYSFAFLIHFILTGRTNPFKKVGKNFKLKLAADPNFRPKLNKDRFDEKVHFLIDLMEKCWAYSPRKRPSAVELREKFAEALKGHVVKNFFQSVGTDAVDSEDVFMLRSESEEEEEEEEEEEGPPPPPPAIEKKNAAPAPPPPKRKPKFGDQHKLVIGKDFDPNSEVNLKEMFDHGGDVNPEDVVMEEEKEEDYEDESLQDLSKEEQQTVKKFDERTKHKAEYRKTLREEIKLQKSSFPEVDEIQESIKREAKKRPISVRITEGFKGLFKKDKSSSGSASKSPKMKKTNFKEYHAGVSSIFTWKSNRNIPVINSAQIEIVKSLSKEESCEVYLVRYQRKEYAYKMFFGVNDYVPEVFMYTHNNLLRNFGICWDEEKESFGILLEYCGLSSLDSFFAESTTQLLVYDKVKLLKGIVESIQYLHSVGQVHGDLQLRDVFLSKSFLPKTSIFTKEKLFEVKEPSHYKSPEVLSGVGEIQPSADIYSLGLIIHEVITENPNSFGISDAEVEEKLLEDPDFRPLIDDSTYEGMEWLQEILEKCWSTNPKKRPSVKKLLSVMADKMKGLMLSNFMGNVSNKDQGTGNEPSPKKVSPKSPPPPPSKPKDKTVEESEGVVDDIMEHHDYQDGYEEEGEYFEEEGEYYEEG